MKVRYGYPNKDLHIHIVLAVERVITHKGKYTPSVGEIIGETLKSRKEAVKEFINKDI